MARIVSLSQLDLNGTYSYADYLKWRLDEYVELIKGKIRAMSPAPSMKHQRVSQELSWQWHSFLRGKKCRVFTAPFDVRLYNHKKSAKANKDVFTVVQPDICVICDEKKLDAKGCFGAPDLVIEILSLGNTKREMKEKFELYQEAGVREYWLVYPYEESLTIFVLNEQTEKYEFSGIYANDETITPHIFPELKIDLNEVFETYRQKEEEND